MKIQYQAKVIVAWGEAISGNAEIRDWLMKNGFPELGLFVFALHNQEKARQWLIENGFPHLMALINGAEGNPNALLWLKKYEFDVLEKTAKVADGDDRALNWLLEHDYRDFAIIGQKIKLVKDQIERDNNDVHKISSE